jgi:hypothetical protein
MVPTFKSKTLITDLYSMNPPDSRRILLFYHPIHYSGITNLVCKILQRRFRCLQAATERLIFLGMLDNDFILSLAKVSRIEPPAFRIYRPEHDNTITGNWQKVQSCFAGLGRSCGTFGHRDHFEPPRVGVRASSSAGLFFVPPERSRSGFPCDLRRTSAIAIRLCLATTRWAAESCRRA